MHRLALAALAAAPLFAGCGESAAASRLYFTAIPDQDQTALKARFEPVAAYLADELGIEVEYKPTVSYEASVEAFKNGDVHLAWFGGLTGVQARAAVEGARAIAQGEVDPHFKSYFVAHVDTGIERSDDFPMALEGRTFTFGPKSSTSGRLMPESFIRTHTQKSPQEFFGSENHNSDGHDHTAKLVEGGSFEAGALNFVTYDKMVEAGTLDPEKCRVVWETPEYADYNWTARPDVDDLFGAGTVDRLQGALVGMSDPELLKAIERPDGLIAAENADFQAIHELAGELGFLD